MNRARDAVSVTADANASIGPDIEGIIDDGSLRVAYQPIHSIHRDQIVGFEALARFDREPLRPPSDWFREAELEGCRIDLELHAITRALEGIGALPGGAFLSLNASPSTIVSPRLSSTLAGAPLERIVLEVTEQEPIDSYDQFAEAMRPLREAGVRLAIDDVGAGYAGLMHIARLHPEILKLDRAVTSHVGTSRSMRALTAAIAGFATEISCAVLAEGIETEQELRLMTALGASLGQGYLLGRPAPAVTITVTQES